MAELVDAPVSGTGGRKPLEVRVFFWAPEDPMPVITQKAGILDLRLGSRFLGYDGYL